MLTHTAYASKYPVIWINLHSKKSDKNNIVKFVQLKRIIRLMQKGRVQHFPYL